MLIEPWIICAALLAFLAWRERCHDQERRDWRREVRDERHALIREALPHFETPALEVQAPEPYGGDRQEWQIIRERRVAMGLEPDDDLEPNYV